MDRKFMETAISLAKEAAISGEIPVGAVIVKNGEIIATEKNTREKEKTALGHAEIAAIDKACKVLKDWRLDDCELYVTLEPCVMCAGAILNARIGTVVFGAYDYTAGAMGSAQNVVPSSTKIEIYGGIMENECTALIKEFFDKVRREENK